ncbi:GH25 family lysozyme [Arthrobacter sp. NPDC058127]|uniref:GH25 family lysozyme n=1 Tax=Arthrobacter sp. NPDC058127 TaxID=3346351 RepID=UPI0036E0E426
MSADALAKFKAAQGPGGARMGQGIQKQSGLRSMAQPGTVSAQAVYMPPGIQGLDVSYYQGNVDWQQQRNMGALFAYVKATEDYGYVNPYFASQYNGSSSVGMIRGAYHFAVPNVSSGAVQANFFASNGGAWSGDGSTLPPLLDIEYNPYPQFGNTCYNLSQSDMVNWISDFSNTMYTRTGRYPAIYTTTDWWRTCTGNTPSFGRQPLHIASYTTAGSPGILPAGWSSYAIWQYSDAGQFVGDQNVFNGSYAELQALATGFDPVLNKYDAMGGSASRLGNQTLSLYCGLRNGGCYRQYDGGQIIWNAATGAQAVYFDGIGSAWRALGGVDGRLGYPTSDETCSSNACSQNFQGGSIYWTTSTNAVPVFTTSIGARWRSMGGTSGILGYPTGSETCSTTACSQTFQSGKIVWTASSGAWAIVQGNIGTAWVALGAENGRLGYPIENQTCTSTQCTQGYQGGILVWTSATPATPVWRTSIGARWLSQGGLSGSLGAPIASETCQVTTCRQAFANGEIFWAAASGAKIISNGQISLKWKTEQAENGRFGVPIGDTEFCGGKECAQDFAGGRILKDPSAATAAFGVLRGTGIGALWTNMGGQQARLSYPTTDESCTASTCTQSFTGGEILWASGIGMGAVYNSGIGSLWRTLGAETGRLGFPTNSETCGANSCTQSFAGGDILWASGIGMGAVYKSGIGGVWRSNGAQQGFFGFPTSTETCTSTECIQYFNGGSIRWNAFTGFAITRY